MKYYGFSGGSVVKNLPANTEDRGSIPGLERSHVTKPMYQNFPAATKLITA